MCFISLAALCVLAGTRPPCTSSRSYINHHPALMRPGTGTVVFVSSLNCMTCFPITSSSALTTTTTAAAAIFQTKTGSSRLLWSLPDLRNMWSRNIRLCFSVNPEKLCILRLQDWDAPPLWRPVLTQLDLKRHDESAANQHPLRFVAKQVNRKC